MTLEAPFPGAKSAGPAPTQESLLAVGQRRLLGTIDRRPSCSSVARAPKVWDTEGRRYLDLGRRRRRGSSLGHAHTLASRKPSPSRPGRLMHMSNYFFNAENIRLADELLHEDRLRSSLLFATPGTEAIERPPQARAVVTSTRPEQKERLRFDRLPQLLPREDDRCARAHRQRPSARRVRARRSPASRTWPTAMQLRCAPRWART